MENLNKFAGKVAIVTGAGEGIGYQIAADLVGSGAQVLLNDIDLDKAREAASAIGCLGVSGDVSDVTVVRGLVEKAVAEFGRIDIAVANAGVTLWSNFFDYEVAAFHNVLNVNLAGSFFLAQAAARQMRTQGKGGRILFMSSVTGFQAIEYLSAYAMSKAALSMLARQLVTELAPLGITTNAIAPGATITPRNLQDDPNYEAVWRNLTPTRKAATVTDIANAALFLLSPEAGQITGQTLIVDGGWTATSAVPALDFVEQAGDNL